MNDFLINFIENEIFSSYYQTKDWRLNQKWYNNKRGIVCENYQVSITENIIDKNIFKTNDRIDDKNMINNEKTPFLFENGFEYSENFDRKLIINKETYYFNYKMICENGGSQIRSLKLVYNFITKQLENLLKTKNKDNLKYFINILDGYFCYKNMEKFKFLLNKSQYKEINKYIYVGDLRDFKYWWYIKNY